MVDLISMQAAELLERLARKPSFDEEAYFRLGLLLQSGVSPLAGAALDEATEFYVTWKHMGNRLDVSEKANKEITRDSRKRMLLFARALKSNATQYSSIEDLQKRYPDEDSL